MARMHVRIVDKMIKLDVALGPLPHLEDNGGVVVQIDTDILNDGKFYTDSNGL
jgi:hypothetical protein